MMLIMLIVNYSCARYSVVVDAVFLLCCSVVGMCQLWNFLIVPATVVVFQRYYAQKFVKRMTQNGNHKSFIHDMSYFLVYSRIRAFLSI